jgi:hypothetical protein
MGLEPIRILLQGGKGVHIDPEPRGRNEIPGNIKVVGRGPMRSRFFQLSAGMVLCALAAQAQMAPPKLQLKAGDVAPDFTLPATTGAQIRLSDFRGKKNVVLAFFFAAFTGG